MNTPNSDSTPCVVVRGAVNFARRAGLVESSNGDLEECKVIESVRRLIAMGLSAEEIAELDIRQPMLQAVVEYAQLDQEDRDGSERAMASVDATLRVVGDEIQKLNLELQMLKMRKKALQRRTRVLRKIAASLQSGENKLMAA